MQIFTLHRFVVQKLIDQLAGAILKDAFGDDFDETKATETADGLLKKYGEDYGAMVGALQSTMGS